MADAKSAGAKTKNRKPARRLGRGLSSLIGEPVSIEAQHSDTADQTNTKYKAPEPETQAAGADVGGLRRIPLDAIVPSRFQPRRTFDEASLAGMAASIASAGVMQPIAVRPLRDGGGDAPDGAIWELIAGERRWRAARLAGLEVVPAVVSDLSDQDAAEWGVVENVQREDLNPMERAWAFRGLVEQFSLSHAAIAERVGLDRSTIANLIRLTELETEIQDLISKGGLSPGHGKALLSTPGGAGRLSLAKRAAEGAWSVRRLESHEGSHGDGAGTKDVVEVDARQSRRAAAIEDLERRIGEKLGSRVRIRTSPDGSRGHVRIDFYDLDHFESLLASLGISQE
ncbi:MAG: ParB/RepB/Spo0J family partition protein [Phycisphaeraceae bacterium]|nr:MAG: ParB/RepB/Spo0J family partition protein [Phycisphaeraceae bacterium]